jgi:hypothetical protein
MAVRNPLGSLPLEGFRAFQTSSFMRQSRNLNAQAYAQVLLESAEEQRLQAEDLRQQSLGLHERIGETWDEFPVLGGLKRGGLTALQAAGTVLGAPGRVLPGAILAAQEGRNPFVGAAEGFLDRRPDINFATVLEGAGMEEGWARNVLGFTIDMISDPLNIFLFAGPAKAAAVAAGRAGRIASRVPGVSPVVERVGRMLATPFSERIGMGQGGETLFHLKLAARKGEFGKAGVKAVQLWEVLNRQIRNIRQGGFEDDMVYVVEGVRRQRVADALREGATQEVAEKQAADLVLALRTNQDLQNELSWGIQNLSKDYRQLRAKPRPPGEDSPLIALAAEFAERTGIKVADLPGASSLVRFLQKEYSFVGDKLGPIAQMSQYIGIENLSDLYMHAYYPDFNFTIGAVTKSEALQRRSMGSAIARKDVSAGFIEKGLDTNIFAGIAHDIAQKRMVYYTQRMIDDDLLRQLGGQKLYLTMEQQQRRVSEGINRGLRMGRVKTMAEGGSSVDEVVEALARPGKTGRMAQEFHEASGRPVSLNDHDLIRQMYDHVDKPNMRLYDPGARSMYLGKAEVDELAGAGVLPKIDDVPGWLLPEPIERSLSKFNSPYEMGTFLRLVDSTFNTMWKPIVTVLPINLSFFTRNAIGLTEMMVQSGMNPWEVVVYGLRGGKFIKQGVRGGVEDVGMQYSAKAEARWASRAEANPGVQTPHSYQADVLWREWREAGGIAAGQRDVPPIDVFTGTRQTGMKGLLARSERYRARILGKRVPKPEEGLEYFKNLLRNYDTPLKGRIGEAPTFFKPMAAGATLNEGMDNSARVGVMLWRMEKFGDTPGEAARVAAKWIGNYSELGAFTAEAAAVLPFFRWSRHSIPTHIEGLLRRPYIGSKTDLLRGDDADEELLNVEMDTLPDWILEKHHVLLGKEEDGRMRVLYGLGLPIEDLNKLFALTPRNTIQNALGEMTPILRAPLELTLDHSFWTGEPISNKEKPWNFYNRAWGWTENIPGLKEFLELEQITGRNGRMFYRANPTRMYIFSSILSRPGFEFDRIGRIAEERDKLTAINFLSGVKFGKIFPESPSRVDFSEALNKNPLLRQAYNELRRIPLYPQFGDPDLSWQANAAIQNINDFKRVLDLTTGKRSTFEEAAGIYGNLDDVGAGLALMVKANRWKQIGRKDRDAFREANPILVLARAELTPSQYDLIFDLAIQP